MAASIRVRSSTRTDSWSVSYTPYVVAISSSRSATVRPSAFRPAASVRTRISAEMPSLSGTARGSTQ